MAHLAVFDTTLQDTNLWLKDIEDALGDCDRHEAYVALRAVLHALRDRLPAQAAVNFAAQLPMLIRGIYFEGWTLPDKPERSHSADEFAGSINAALPPRYRFDALACAEAVFSTITRRTSDGEAEKVMAQLPVSIRELWS